MLAIIFLVKSLNPRPPYSENLYPSIKLACLINTTIKFIMVIPPIWHYYQHTYIGSTKYDIKTSIPKKTKNKTIMGTKESLAISNNFSSINNSNTIYWY
jgi:hypothetical protein